MLPALRRQNRPLPQKDKQNTSLIITYRHHGERLHTQRAVGCWNTKPQYKKRNASSIITLISLRLHFIFFLWLCFLLFFWLSPSLLFSCMEDTRLELGDWGIWSIPLAGWGGLKKSCRREREEMFPASRWGRAGGTETQLVIAWGEGGFKTGSETSFNYLFRPVMTQSCRQYPEALSREVFTLHKPKPSPLNQLIFFVLPWQASNRNGWFFTNPASLLQHHEMTK